VFWFGTLVASKNPEGAKEKFKIMNPNKIPCTVKFAVNPRTQSKSEGFAFEVEPKGLTIEPHKHKYVTVNFLPTAMMQYGGLFEAIVENGDPESKMGKLVFELRGEGTLPTLQVEKPEADADGTVSLKFRKTRIGKDCILPIILKNEGQVPATVRFDAITNDSFTFEGGSLSNTITQKSYHGFDIRYRPKSAV
jgi:hydrocephalus-inducing protein